jgi:replicative DNA helicase
MNSRTDLLALRTGNVFDTEAASSLAGLPILIDDTPGISIMELRTKARRASTHDRLEVIVVDYIQLMRTGEHEENRVQEIATITKNLKSLARELNVVVIGLSQLSRAAGDSGVEPKLSTLRECVTGETLVCLADGRRVPIRDLVGTTPDVLSIRDGRIVTAKSDLVWSVGPRPVYRVGLASGREIRATAEHRLYGFDGWRRVGELREGDRLAIARRLPEPAETVEWSAARIALLGQLIGDGSYLVHQPLRYTSSSPENRDVVARAAIDEFNAIVYPQRPIGSWQQLYIGNNGNRWHPAGVNGWLRELGIFGQRSDQKRLPREIFRLPNQQLAILLQHLWATDGTISISKPGRRGGHSVYYATNSTGLAGDVAALLLRFGIVTRTYEVEEEGYLPGYQVNVSGTEAQQRFLDQIGAFGPRVEPAAALAEALIGIEPNTNVDTVPREVFASVKARMRANHITQRAMATMRGTSYGGTSHFNFSPSRAMVIEYAALLDDDELFAHASSDLFWDTVVEVTQDGEEEVFDLTVPGPASWLADGIVSHNSGAIEQDSDVVLMLWRDKEDTAVGAPKLIHGSIAKNRNGPTGIFSLLFAAEQAKFFSKAADDQMPV